MFTSLVNLYILPLFLVNLLTSFKLGTHYKFSHDDIVALIEQAQRFIEKASSLSTPSAPAIISSSVTWLIQLSDIWLVKALKKYPIAGLHVVSLVYTSSHCILHPTQTIKFNQTLS